MKTIHGIKNQTSIKFAYVGQVDNKAPLVEVIGWRCYRNHWWPIPLTHICVDRARCVKKYIFWTKTWLITGLKCSTKQQRLCVY